ncbi:hypothetical protein BGZ67_007762 [Mortierella alpina]|nr:hypothetical protein BGZ67_007762 [Mortierella alpina]
MFNDDILASPVVPLSKKPTLLRTPTPLALSDDILTPASDTSPPSLSLASTSGQDTATDGGSSVSHTLEKRKYSTAADDHFHEYPSHAAAITTTTTSNDPPVNTTSGEHAATSNSGDTLRKILESRRRILELLARHAREEDSAIARLTKENTVYNKTLYHIPAPIFSRGSGSKRRGTFRRKGSTASWSSHSQSIDDALTCPRRATTRLKVKVVSPSSPCPEVPKSPDYQADDELDELEDEDSLITGPAPPSPPIKTKASNVLNHVFNIPVALISTVIRPGPDPTQQEGTP